MNPSGSVGHHEAATTALAEGQAQAADALGDTKCDISHSDASKCFVTSVTCLYLSTKNVNSQ